MIKATHAELVAPGDRIRANGMLERVEGVELELVEGGERGRFRVRLELEYRGHPGRARSKKWGETVLYYHPRDLVLVLD